MENAKPVGRPQKRCRKNPPKPVEKAEHLQPIEEAPEVKELSVRDRRYLANQGAGKYAHKPKVGTPTLGRSPAYVSEPGLGTLITTTIYDNTDVST